MKKIGKNLKIVLLIIALLFSINTKTFAKENIEEQPISKISSEEVIRVAGVDDIIGAGRNFIKAGETEEYNETYFAEQFIDIGSILVAIGVATLLIVTAVMAIKWMVAKPDQKAKLQQQLIGLVVAAVVIFGAIGIWNLVRGIMSTVEGNLEGTAGKQTTVMIAKR